MKLDMEIGPLKFTSLIFESFLNICDQNPFEIRDQSSVIHTRIWIYKTLMLLQQDLYELTKSKHAHESRYKALCKCGIDF